MVIYGLNPFELKFYQSLNLSSANTEMDNIRALASQKMKNVDLPQVLSKENAYLLNEKTGKTFSISEYKKIQYTGKLTLRGENFSVTVNRHGEDEINEYVDFKAFDVLSAIYMAKFKFATKNAISFNTVRYLEPLTLINNRYKTVYCKKNNNIYEYVALLDFSKINYVVNFINSCEKSNYIVFRNFDILKSFEGFRFIYDKNKVFSVWVVNENEDTFLSGQAYGVPTAMVSNLGYTENIYNVLYNSPFAFDAGFRKVKIFNIDAVLVDKFRDSFNVSTGVTRTVVGQNHSYSLSNYGDKNFIVPIYNSVENINVVGGIAFRENDYDGVAGMAGVYFWIDSSAKVVFVRSKASNFQTTMNYIILNYEILREPDFIYEGSINWSFKQYEKICDLYVLPKFLKVLVGDGAGIWIQDDISHNEHVAVDRASAENYGFFSMSFEKKIMLTEDKYELYIRRNTYNTSPFNIRMVKVLAWY